MKKHLLLTLSIFTVILSLSKDAFAQCTATPPAGTFIMSPLTVGTNYTLNGTTTYATQRAFYICQGTTVTIQNRVGMDTFYVSSGATLIGFEANGFRVLVKNGGTYNASSGGTATVYWETGASILNFTGPPLPPCPGLTISMSLIGPNACTTTDIVEHSNVIGNIFLFPNPAQNEIAVNIYVSSANMNVAIYDMIGNIVLQHITASNQMKLDISSFAKGIYFLRVMNGNEIVGTEKFIKN